MMDKISTQYNQAVQLIKSAILQNQLEAVRLSTDRCSHCIMVWANMFLITPAKDLGHRSH